MARPKNNRSRNDPRAARKDSMDFRDLVYEPNLRSLPRSVLPNPRFLHIRDQGQDGACTGFALAALINYLIRVRGESKDEVSPRMLYEMAKRYDQWPVAQHRGSTARGAMKGWYKHGACLDADWPYVPGEPGTFSGKAQMSALEYPLGAFYRVQTKRSHLHAALNEVPVVFVTAATQKGWDAPKNGVIEFDPASKQQGAHAFSIIGYTDQGFLIQNSWGHDWGGVKLNGKSYPGCAIWQYPDFDRNVWDAWVAQLDRPLESREALRHATTRRRAHVMGTRNPPPRVSIAGHFIHMDDGGFQPNGDYFSTEDEVRSLVQHAVHGGANHILLYAHGGWNAAGSIATRIDNWRPIFDSNRIHEIHMMWETGLGDELRDIILSKQKLVEARAVGHSDWWNRWFERVTGPLGEALWKGMVTDAEAAFQNPDMGGSKVLEFLAAELPALPARSRPRLHLVGESTGAVFLGHLLEQWSREPDRPAFENLILFAPACTHDFFKNRIKPALAGGVVKKLSHLYLDDQTEQADNVAQVYRRSLLYLVSRSYQAKMKIVPILGMEKYMDQLPVSGVAGRIRNYSTGTHPAVTSSNSHFGFDRDPITMNSMLGFVLGKKQFRRFQNLDLKGY